MDLEKYKDELAEIDNFLATPDAYSTPDFAAKAKRANLLREIIDLANAPIVEIEKETEDAAE